MTVYHVSSDVDAHVAQLKRLSRFRVTCVDQRKISSRGPMRASDLVLWELASGRRPGRRRIESLARGVPFVSYSIEGTKSLAHMSRALGFAAHLKAPLSSVEIERQLLLGESLDLSTRLRRFQTILRRHLAKPDVMAEVYRSVNVSVEPKKVADALVGHAARWLPVPAWAVIVPDESAVAKVVASRGLTARLQRGALALGKWVVRRGDDAISADLSNDRRTPKGPPVAALGFPMVSRGRTVGALIGLDLTKSERALLLGGPLLDAVGMLLEPAAVAFENAVNLKRAESLSVTDDLTRLYNSRFLGLVLRRETKRTSRSGYPLSMLFIDMDGFKIVNDNHGHLYGSRALVEAAQVIKVSARETDVVARFGGDEFAVVLPDTDTEGAKAVGERVRDEIAAHKFLASAGFDIRLTASVGVATLPGVASNADGLLQAADRAMYEVKAQGKNGIYRRRLMSAMQRMPLEPVGRLAASRQVPRQAVDSSGGAG